MGLEIRSRPPEASMARSVVSRNVTGTLSRTSIGSDSSRIGAAYSSVAA